MSTSDSSGLIHGFLANDGPYLMLGDGLKTVIDLTHPSTNYPAFVVSIGRGISAKPPARHAHPLVAIEFSSFSANHSQPVCMVSVDLEHLYSNFPSRKHYHHPHSHRIEWAANSADYTTHNIVDSMLSRLILLFSDVVCLFLDDFSSPEEAIALVTQWSRVLPNLNPFWKPTLLLASRKSPTRVDREDMPFFNIISTLKIFTRRSKLLEKAVLQAIAPVHKQRALSQSLFSAQHLVSFFKAGLKHFAQGLDNFDLVSATRNHNPIDSSLVTHIRTFLELCVQDEASKEFAFRYVASALVMDSSPPEMHRELHTLCGSSRVN